MTTKEVLEAIERELAKADVNDLTPMRNGYRCDFVDNIIKKYKDNEQNL